MLRILVVDDSPLMRRYVSRTLEMTGFDVDVHEASNGRDALRVALETHPDLIITDLNMPEMSGEELVAKVAQDPALRGTPMLVVSADHSAGRPQELMHSGAFGYLTKPVAPEILRDRLLEIIGRRKEDGRVSEALESVEGAL